MNRNKLLIFTRSDREESKGSEKSNLTTDTLKKRRQRKVEIDQEIIQLCVIARSIRSAENF